MYIPKADGRQRPLGIATLEDKILQRAVVEVLNAIYEVDFLGFSYGFRPGRSPHDALDALAAGIYAEEGELGARRGHPWISSTAIDHGWLVKFLEHRIADRRVLRLIQKWLTAGVIEDGRWTASDGGHAARGDRLPRCSRTSISTTSSTCGLEQWRRRHARGDVVIVRYADDFVVGFQHECDARQFLARPP